MSDDLVKGAAWSLNTLMPIAEKQQAEIEKLRRQVDILREGLKRLEYNPKFPPSCSCHTVVSSTLAKAAAVTEGRHD